jgi:hypothetical protein
MHHLKKRGGPTPDISHCMGQGASDEQVENIDPIKERKIISDDETSRIAIHALP